MDKLFQECFLSRLNDTGSVFPFFWQHGENHATLEREMDAIRNDGSTEFCVESRTHEEFCNEQWWEDFRFMLEYARKHGMRVWLLDDKRFPTGYANGYIDSHPELRRRVLRLVFRDLTGPAPGGQIALPDLNPARKESIVSVSAYRRAADFHTVTGRPVDLTGRADERGIIDWEVPAGTWRVFTVIAGTVLPTDTKGNYVDMLSPASADAMLHAVYEPHYERFKDYFGNTFRGFFSDEPSFANGAGSYEHTVGTEDLTMPWRDDLPELIGREIGKSADEVRLRLPALWQNLPGFGPAVRAGYMDRITLLYRDNFCNRLGDWCRERKVLYIGHIIEDMNTHQRLGYGAGHYFRSLWGQDMAGLDIVLNQMVPRNLDVIHTGPVCGKKLDPAFFHYALAKLGSSAAHIQPEKENRVMAEVFGAFGWAAGVGYLKYLADHMLSCGVNHFVPHAYTPKYPDRDCPPHFHAAGKNPQEPAFGMLIRYMQKVSRLTADSVHRADVAVFYNAEAEWTGGKNTLMQETCRRLTRDQIDFDILPEDVLYEAAVEDGRLKIANETYGALIVPYCQILPDRILHAFARLQNLGLPVIYEDRAPARAASGRSARVILGECAAVPAARLTEEVRRRGWYRITLSPACPTLRVYEADRGAEKIFLLFNEGADGIDARMVADGVKQPVFYDVWNNTVRKPDVSDDGVRVKLASGQALVLLSGAGAADALPYDYRDKALTPVSADWKISLREAGAEGFRFYRQTKELPRFNRADELPDFCGTIRYETELTADGSETLLDLGVVGEIAAVTLNGKNCGTAVAAPYTFDLSKALKPGKNRLCVDVVNNPVYREKANDRYTTYLPLPASGLLGPVRWG